MQDIIEWIPYIKFKMLKILIKGNLASKNCLIIKGNGYMMLRSNSS